MLKNASVADILLNTVDMMKDCRILSPVTDDTKRLYGELDPQKAVQIIKEIG